MNTILILGYLLAIVGIYAFTRGVAMGKHIVKRNTFREIFEMFVGIVGFYECTLGFIFIISQSN